MQSLETWAFVLRWCCFRFMFCSFCVLFFSLSSCWVNYQLRHLVMPIWVVEICVKQTGLGTAWQFFLRVENIVEDKSSLFSVLSLLQTLEYLQSVLLQDSPAMQWLRPSMSWKCVLGFSCYFAGVALMQLSRPTITLFVSTSEEFVRLLLLRMGS